MENQRRLCPQVIYRGAPSTVVSPPPLALLPLLPKKKQKNRYPFDYFSPLSFWIVPLPRFYCSLPSCTNFIAPELRTVKGGKIDNITTKKKGIEGEDRDVMRVFPPFSTHGPSYDSSHRTSSKIKVNE